MSCPRTTGTETGASTTSGSTSFFSSSSTTSTTNVDVGNFPTKTKIVVIGDHGIGKAAFVSAFSKGDVIDSMSKWRAKKVQPSFVTKTVNFENRDLQVVLQYSAGQERYRSLTSSYYRGIHGCILLYNVHNQESFDNLPSWIDDVHRYCANEELCLVLVGIKNRISGPGDSWDSSSISSSSRCSSIDSPNALDNRLLGNCGSDTIRPVVASSPRDIISKAWPTSSQKPQYRSFPSTIHGNGPSTFYTPVGSLQDRHLSRSAVTHDSKENYRTLKFQLSEDYGNDMINDGNKKFCGSDGVNENLRVIPREMAERFAYSQGIPYREVDLEHDYSSLENVISRVLSGIIFNNRKNSSVFGAVDLNSINLRSTERNGKGGPGVHCWLCWRC